MRAAAALDARPRSSRRASSGRCSCSARSRSRYGLGLDAPWYLAELTAIGYVRSPAVVIALGWLAVAGQLAALSTGRYAPYPSGGAAAARADPGDGAAIVLTVRSRRRAPGADEKAAEG